MRSCTTKKSNWFKHAEDSIYALHIDDLTQDAPKKIVRKAIIDGSRENVRETREFAKFHKLLCGKPNRGLVRSLLFLSIYLL